MALKEKTVELNLTSEVMNLLLMVTKRRVSVWAPTPHQEATLGYDAKVRAAGFKLFIQYKAAKWHKSSGEWRFKLNDTAAQDQHQRLCGHANAGITTRYGLPLIDSYKVLHRHMQTGRLFSMPQVLWIDPRNIQMPKGGKGVHTLGVQAVSPHQLTVRSEPIEFSLPPNGIGSVVREILVDLDREKVAREREALNKSSRGRGGDPPGPPDDNDGDDGDDGGGTGFVAFRLH